MKKAKLQDGQLVISFGLSGLQLEQPTDDPEPTEPGTSTHRGSVESWKTFSQVKYIQNHPWLLIKADGIYCQYCSACQPHIQSGTCVFISSPYTGNQPDKLLQHECCRTHMESEESHRESLI